MGFEMKNRRILSVILIFFLLIVVSIVIKINIDNNKLVKKENVLVNEISLENYNQTKEEKAEIKEIEQSVGITGNTQLYEVQEDTTNNMKIVTIKPSIKYKVAFTGMIKNEQPKIEEVDTIIKQNHPKYAGIWINSKDRDTILKLFSNFTNSDYFIDENGYLKIESKNWQNNNDKVLEKAIYGDKLFILNISSICYIVDDVSGEVLDYNFEKMDKYQTYESFEDSDKIIVFINKNSEKQLDDSKIVESIIKLFSLTIM